MTNLSNHFDIVKHRRRLQAMRWMMMGVAASFTLLIAGFPAAAGNLEIKPAVAKGLVIKGLRGEVEVIIGQRPEVEITIEGEDEALDLVKSDVKNDAFMITIPTESTNIATVDGNVTSITSGGGTSNVQIGNQTFVDLFMTATVPEGTIVRLEGFVGDAQIGDTGADVVLNCASCDAALGKIAALDVTLAGAGDVTAKRVERALAASIAGDGSIEILDGDLDHATLTITGSGAIDFGGRAVNASVNIVGSGDVRLREVDNPIQSTIIGAGDVVTGE